MPSWELFETQSKEYRDSVLPPAVHARLAVEAGATQGWWRYVGDRGDVIGVDRFGASAPGPVVMREYGFSVENVCKRAMALLEAEHPGFFKRTRPRLGIDSTISRGVKRHRRRPAKVAEDASIPKRKGKQ